MWSPKVFAVFPADVVPEDRGMGRIPMAARASVVAGVAGVSIEEDVFECAVAKRSSEFFDEQLNVAVMEIAITR